MEKPSLLARLFRPSAKSVADPWAAIYAMFGVTETASGITVSADAAIKVPAVGRAIRLISQAAASLPRVVKKVGADGKETLVEGHWAEALLNRRANDWTSGFELVRDLMVDALTDDAGGLLWANRLSDGRVFELIRYRSGLVNVDYNQTNGRPYYRIDNRQTPGADMVHLRPCFGRAPLSLAREAIAIALVLERHASNLFGKGARPSGSLIFPKGMGEEAVKKAIAGWRAVHEAGEGAKTAILYDGAEFKPHAFTSTDAQYIENRNFQVIEVARAFDVPPSLLFQLDRATWGNVEQMSKDFLVNTLEPWLCAAEGAFTRALFPKDSGLVVRFDRDDMTRADLVTRATAISSLIGAEVLNRNEGREWLGMAPYAGGDRFGNPHIGADQGGRPTKQEVPPNATL